MSNPTANLRMVWMSMLGASVLYAVLGFSGIYKSGTPVVIGLPLLPILAAVALVLAVAAVMLRGRLFDRVAGISTNDPRRPVALTQASIIPWALDEMIAVFGVVLMILGRPAYQWLPFCALSFAMLLLHAPRDDA